jgi:hypothetical protein
MGSTLMPTVRFSRGPAFDPEHVLVMLTAFDEACAKLRLRKSDRKTDLVASKIVDLAKAGERDAHRLVVHVLRQFERGPLQPL